MNRRKLLKATSAAVGLHAAASVAHASTPAAASSADPAAQLLRLTEDDLAAVLAYRPVQATFLGIDGYNDRLNDLSDAGEQAFLAGCRERLRRLESIDARELHGQARVTYELLGQSLRSTLRLSTFRNAERLRLSSQFGGLHLLMPRLAPITPFRSVADYEAYAQRLSQMPARLDSVIELTRRAMREGWINPRAAMERVPAQIDGQLSVPLNDDPILAPFANVTKWPQGADSARRAALESRCRQLVQDQYRPALQRLRAFIVDELLPKAPSPGGLSQMPQGKAYYSALIETSITPKATPEQIHKIGLEEVARIQGELRALARKERFDGDLLAYFNHKINDPAQYTDSPQALLAEYRKVGERVDAAVGRVFRRLPRAGVDIVEMPAPEARQNSAERYVGPAVDGSRPGNFVLNTLSYRSRARYQMVSLYMHEALPGHHLQIALARELTDLPRWRSLISSNVAFSEGWALYAEKLGVELGLYEDTNSDYGRLIAEIWRAGRLVVDTGIHFYGWSREQAIRYLVTQAGLIESTAASEVDRYFVLPGQALGYKMGELKIVELRARAQKLLGPRFDVRDFHAVVLENGGVTLPVLETLVDAWIAAGGGSARI